MQNKALATASVVSAALASLCCIGPLVAVGLGLGAFGASAVFESLRPYLLVATAALLGMAFYLTYRQRSEETCQDGSCAVVPPTKLRKRLLWLATAIVVPLAAFPYYSAALPGGPGLVAEADRAASAGLSEAVFDVDGMTCAGCAAAVRSALDKTAGVEFSEVSAETKLASVRYDASFVSPGKLESVINGAGFAGKLRQDATAANVTEVFFAVEGMDCPACALGIQAKLARQDGVREVEVDYEKRTARLVIEPAKITMDQLAAAFRELGYVAIPKNGA
jgi:copper ion binding protein